MIQQLLSAVGCAVLLGSAAMAQAPAGVPATFKVKGGTGVQQGMVLGADAGGVRIQIGAQMVALPPGMFESFQMNPPPEYAQGFQSFTARDFPKALALIKSVTDRYKGLPTEWAQYATSLLAEIYLSQNDLPKAAAAYADLKKLYPNSSSTASDVGEAAIAAAKKDYAAAKAKIDPLLAEALKQKSVPALSARAYSKAFLVSGQIKEAEGNLPGALEDYLRTVTIFYHDPAAQSMAQEKADALRSRDKEHPVTAP